MIIAEFIIKRDNVFLGREIYLGVFNSMADLIKFLGESREDFETICSGIFFTSEELDVEYGCYENDVKRLLNEHYDRMAIL